MKTGKDLNVNSIIKNRNSKSFLAVLFFALYFWLGLCAYKDYGMTPDEAVQRTHSLTAYKYINQKLFHRNVPELADLEDLTEYSSRYYGTAVQIPMVIVEDLFGFGLTTRQIYLMRHLYNYLVCFTGYVCFYFVLSIILSDSVLALWGAMLVSLYPRYFASQFYDIKNMIFAALNMATLLTLVLVVRKQDMQKILLFCFMAALTTNQRVMGVIFPAVLLMYFLMKDITDGVFAGSKWQNLWDAAPKYVQIIVFYLLFWTVVTPAAWEKPLQTFYHTFATFAHYEKWDGTMVFMGNLVTCAQRPWYYLFVWFGISIPLAYIFLFMMGHVYVIVSLYKSKHRWLDMLGTYRWLACFLVLFWGAVGAVIVLDSRIYVEWRHMFFVFVPFCGIAVYGLKYLSQILNQKTVSAVLCLLMAGQLIWIVQNHPYQQVYFNSAGRQYAAGFDRDSWRAANQVMLRWILQHEEGEVSVKGETAAYALLTEDEKTRVAAGADDAEYIIESYRNVIGSSVVYEGYEEVFTIWLDGFKIGSVYKCNFKNP